MKKVFFTVFIASLLSGTASAQLIPMLKQHIVFLASDSLHGRLTGSEDEDKAAAYIVLQFEKNKIANPMGKVNIKKYLQPFEFNPVVDSARVKVAGNNVIAYIDNHAANNIIIGAHYDHLGMGDPHHSLYRGAPAVHNGADDNASGVAAMLELAKMLKASDLTNYNYVFIAFSGEEEGLYGSKWYVEHPPFDLKKTNYMLNFDMVGRIDTTTQTLILNGAGTSPAWKPAIEAVKSPLHIKTTESGIGPSDQTSFYLKDIPVLFFFSGQHKDYHKPTDDEDKINYDGLAKVVNYAFDLIKELNGKDKLAFTKTKDDNNENAPKFKVTLGVMPDYTFEGEGMRIDAVTDDRPAAKAGLLAGDIVVQLGDIKVTEMMSYMKALGQFNKGDKTKVKVKRGGQIIEKEVVF